MKNQKRKLPRALVQNGREYRVLGELTGAAPGSLCCLAVRADHDYARGPAPLVAICLPGGDQPHAFFRPAPVEATTHRDDGPPARSPHAGTDSTVPGGGEVPGDRAEGVTPSRQDAKAGLPAGKRDQAAPAERPSPPDVAAEDPPRPDPAAPAAGGIPGRRWE